VIGKSTMATVLITEDIDTNFEIFKRVLEKENHNIIRAVDGTESIEITRTSSVDIILMDLGLPGIDGWQATKIIKSDPANKDVPIIALTAHTLQNEIQKAMEAGCCDFIAKPLANFNILTDTINKHLSYKQPCSGS
jgi:CheY-like chemotaxis protein